MHFVDTSSLAFDEDFESVSEVGMSDGNSRPTMPRSPTLPARIQTRLPLPPPPLLSTNPYGVSRIPSNQPFVPPTATHPSKAFSNGTASYVSMPGNRSVAAESMQSTGELNISV